MAEEPAFRAAGGPVAAVSRSIRSPISIRLHQNFCCFSYSCGPVPTVKYSWRFGPCSTRELAAAVNLLTVFLHVACPRFALHFIDDACPAWPLLWSESPCSPVPAERSPSAVEEVVVVVAAAWEAVAAPAWALEADATRHP